MLKGICDLFSHLTRDRRQGQGFSTGHELPFGHVALGPKGKLCSLESLEMFPEGDELALEVLDVLRAARRAVAAFFRAFARRTSRQILCCHDIRTFLVGVETGGST